MNNPTDLIMVQFTPTLDTGAYTGGDTLFDTMKVPAQLRAGYIRYITVLDKDDVASESVNLYFLSSNVTFGTFNAVPSISDANAMFIIGSSGAVVASTDLGGCKVGSLAVNIPFELDASAALYVAATTATALTHTASGVVITLIIERWT